MRDFNGLPNHAKETKIFLCASHFQIKGYGIVPCNHPDNRAYG